MMRHDVTRRCSATSGRHRDRDRRGSPLLVLLCLHLQEMLLQAEEEGGWKEGTQGSRRYEQCQAAWDGHEGEGQCFAKSHPLAVPFPNRNFSGCPICKVWAWYHCF